LKVKEFFKKPRHGLVVGYLWTSDTQREESFSLGIESLKNAVQLSICGEFFWKSTGRWRKLEI